MEIRNRSNGELTTISQFRASRPTTSFPKQITTEILNNFGYDPVLNGPAVSTVPPYEISMRSGVEKIEGQWFTKFVPGPVFTDTTDDDGNVTTAADNKAAYKAGIDAHVATNVRSERDRLIAETDWIVVKAKETSTNVPTAIKTYRQELRDLPTASGFPHTMTWPTKPS